MKISTKILLSSVFTALLAITTGCSDRSGALVDCIPADEEFALVGNIEDIVESLGGTIENNKISLPSFVTQELSGQDFEQYKEYISKIKDSGIACENVAIAANYKDYMPVFIVKVDDEKKFKRFAEDEGFDDEGEEDGIRFFLRREKSDYGDYYRDHAIGLKKGYAYYTQSSKYSDVKAQRVIERFIENAQEAPMSRTKIGNFISKGQTIGGAFKIPKEAKREMRNSGMSAEAAAILDGYICFSAKLEGDKLTGNLCALDEDGKKIDFSKAYESYYDKNATVSSKALSYLNKKEQLVFAVSLKNVKWNKILDQASANMYGQSAMYIAIVKEYLNKIDGTVAMGFGFTGGLDALESLNRNPLSAMSQISFTMVVETKPGKAKGVFNDITELLDNTGIAYSKSGKSNISMSLPENMGDYYMKYDENLLIISTNPIKESGDNPVVKGYDLDDFFSGIGLVLDGKSELMKDLGLSAYNVGAFIACDVKDNELKYELKINGKNKEGVLGQLVRLGMDYYEYMQEMRRNSYNSYDDYDYYEEYDDYDDWEYTDSVAVVDDYYDY